MQNPEITKNTMTAGVPNTIDCHACTKNLPTGVASFTPANSGNVSKCPIVTHSARTNRSASNTAYRRWPRDLSNASVTNSFGRPQPTQRNSFPVEFARFVFSTAGATPPRPSLPPRSRRGCSAHDFACSPSCKAPSATPVESQHFRATKARISLANFRDSRPRHWDGRKSR